MCSNGTCQLACEPQCGGKQCGSDGCGDLCGTCAANQACNADGQCVALCEKQCLNKECGDDGCGGLCGNCGFSATCSSDGLCVPGGDPEDDPKDDPEGDDDVWAPGSESDAKGSSGTAGEPDVESGTGPTSCQFGESLVYGKCVPDSQLSDEDDGAADSGCSTGRGATPTGILILLFLAVLLMVRRTRGPRCRQPDL